VNTFVLLCGSVFFTTKAAKATQSITTEFLEEINHNLRLFIIFVPSFPIGVPYLKAEIILFEPDPGNAGVGRSTIQHTFPLKD